MTPGLTRGHLHDFRSLRRSTSDRRIAGVAGGLGRHFNVDPLVLRVAFVVLAFFGGAGLALYGAIWLLVPQDDEADAMIHTNERVRNALIVGALLIAALMVVGNSWGGWHFPWLPLLVALVVFGVLASRDARRAGGQRARAWASGEGRTEFTHPAPDYTEQYKEQLTADTVREATMRAVSRTYRGPILFGPTLALIAIGLGVLGIVDADHRDIPDAAYPALALGITGFMLVVGAFFGRPGGLILIGVLAALALPLVAISEPRFGGDRDVQAHPTLASQVNGHYRVPAGRIELDLTDVADLQALSGRTVKLDAHAGEIVVIVPSGLAVVVDADIGLAGDTTLFGDDRGGLGVSSHTSRGTTTGALKLDIDIDLGHIEVREQS